MGLFRRGQSHSQAIAETIVAADVKARAEVLLNQMDENLSELRTLILGDDDDDGGGARPKR